MKRFEELMDLGHASRRVVLTTDTFDPELLPNYRTGQRDWKLTPFNETEFPKSVLIEVRRNGFTTISC